MEVKINREIRDYQESIFFGLNLRQLVFSILAIGVAIGIYFGLNNILGTETVSWMCVLGAAPFAAMGFIRYNGMNAEEFIGAYSRAANAGSSAIFPWPHGKAVKSTRVGSPFVCTAFPAALFFSENALSRNSGKIRLIQSVAVKTATVSKPRRCAFR